jgi:oligopeptide transport system permease protein
MLRYTIRRLLLLIPTFIGASALIFFAGLALHGDPVAALGGERAMTPATRQLLIERYHLDKPVLEQYVLYLGNVLHGDLGESVLKRRSVTDIFKETFPVTLRLAILAWIFEIVIGMTAGILAALRRDKFLDQLVLVSTTIAISIPVFVLGFAGRGIFAARWPIFPVGGITHGWWSYVLPGMVIATLSLAYIARILRTSLLETLREDYIRTAEAKGLRPSRVVGRHALRNALIPVVTFVAIDFAALMGGAIVTETIFNLPGVGFTLIRAIGTRDLSIVVGFTMAAVIIFMMVSLLIDLLYAVLDPRIRYE